MLSKDRCFRNQSELMPGIHKSLKILSQALSPFTHTYVLRRTLVAKAELYCGKDQAAWVGPPSPMSYPFHFLHPCRVLNLF